MLPTTAITDTLYTVFTMVTSYILHTLATTHPQCQSCSLQQPYKNKYTYTNIPCRGVHLTASNEGREELQRRQRRRRRRRRFQVKRASVRPATSETGSRRNGNDVIHSGLHGYGQRDDVTVNPAPGPGPREAFIKRGPYIRTYISFDIFPRTAPRLHFKYARQGYRCRRVAFYTRIHVINPLNIRF
jgi:hypothetical protein